MDLLASLNLHELPEQQTKINKQVSSALKANPDIRVSALWLVMVLSHHVPTLPTIEIFQKRILTKFILHFLSISIAWV